MNSTVKLEDQRKRKHPSTNSEEYDHDTNSEGYRDKLIIKLLDRVEALEEKIPRMEMEHHEKMRSIDKEMAAKFEKLEKEYGVKMDGVVEKREIETIRMVQRYKRALAENRQVLLMSVDVIEKQADLMEVFKNSRNLNQRAIWSLEERTREYTNELRGYCNNGYGMEQNRREDTVSTPPPSSPPPQFFNQPPPRAPWTPGFFPYNNYAPPQCWYQPQYYMAPSPPPPVRPLVSLTMMPAPPPPPPPPPPPTPKVSIPPPPPIVEYPDDWSPIYH